LRLVLGDSNIAMVTSERDTDQINIHYRCVKDFRLQLLKR
jgi:hypothetical protein